VIGGGPIGVELAQAYARLGSKVYVFERSSHLLSKEDEDVSQVVEKVFKKEGITVLTGAEITKASKKSGKKVLSYKKGGKTKSISGDEILLAVGRSPNVEGLGLDEIGIEYDKRSIKVNQYLQTSVKNIYAIGDVKGGFLFTHMASYEAGIVIANTLFHMPIKANYSIVPWTTYTDPEVAHVGLTEKEAQEQHPGYYALKYPFKDVSYCVNIFYTCL